MLDHSQFRAIALGAAIGLAILLGSGTATGAASLSVSDPEIVAYFSFIKGQTPEAIAAEPDGAVDISLADASAAVRVERDGQVVLLGKLPRSGNCPVIGHPASAGIARDYDGTVLLVNCTGNGDTGVWQLRRGSAPLQIASLPPNSFPHNIALDVSSGSLYVTDSVLGAVSKIPADGGTPTTWAAGAQLQRTSLFGANGIAIHRGAVWVSNTDNGTIVEIPIQRDGSAGTIRTAVEGLSGGLDNFVLLDSYDTIIAALTLSKQVVLIDPDSQPQVVLTAADGLSNPTAVAVVSDTLYVCNGAYFTKIDPNLLAARLERQP